MIAEGLGGLRLRAYLFLVKARLLEGLTYRFEVISGVATRLVLTATAVYLWRAAFAGGAEANGSTEHDMVRYVIVSSVIAPILATRVERTIYDRVKTGDIALDLLRPIAMPMRWLAEDVGGSASSGLKEAVPLLLIVTLLFGPALPEGPMAGLLFLMSASLSFGIVWLLSGLCGLVAFWATEIGNLGAVKDGVLRILSGSLVPLWFFPDWAQSVSRFLPFQYTYQTPLAIFIGRDLGEGGVTLAFLAQAAWIVILGALFAWTWSRGRRRLMAQGG